MNLQVALHLAVLESGTDEQSLETAMKGTEDIRIEEWRGDPARDLFFDAEIGMLAEVLHAVVNDGAGVSFVAPFSIPEARAFWVDRVVPSMRAGTRRILVARLGERIVGTVQIELEMPPNQQHRAGVAKLLVHPDARRRGVAKALMNDLEEVARAEGRTLLTLDTVSGSGAEFLYSSLGYATAGVIPGYARGALTPEVEDAAFMYKELKL